jgi:DNA gyrase, A subunit
MNEKIREVNIAEQSYNDLRAYAIYVSRFRAIPNYIDGLKPVVRRILWCAYNDFPGNGFIKTSAIMGRVIQRYNPHGDSSVHMAIRNMVNEVSIKIPTMDGEGSWGSKANPTPAAPRYNDCRLSKFAMDVFLKDIDEDRRSTDWQANYDNTCKEPVYLPARIPALLVLGQLGIAIGIKVSIPSHNLGDVIDATIALMKNPNAKFCLIPDECMPCEIFQTDFQKINDTGMGQYIAQGIVDIIDYNGHPALAVRSLPDFTFFDSIKENILNLVKAKKMPYIVDLISRSKVDLKTSKTLMEEIIVLKKGSDPNFVREFLYNNTAIRQTRQVKLITIKDNNLDTNVNGYRGYLLNFIAFRRVTVYRKLNARLQKLNTDIHERMLYLKVMTSGEVDNIIKMIKKQDTRDDNVLVEYLVSKLHVTTLQAKFLLGTDIRRLSKGYLKKYQEDIKNYEAQVHEITNILLNPANIDKYIIDEMLEIKHKYNTPRCCKIISAAEAQGVAPGTFKLIFTKKNFIRKIGENDAAGSFANDEYNFAITVDNTEDILVFTDLGKVFRLPVSKIPLYAKGSYGADIRILNKYITSNVICAGRDASLQKLATKNGSFAFIVTRAGYIKKIDLKDVLTAPPSGFIISKLDQGDFVRDIIFGPDKLDILVCSESKILRIPAKEVPYLKRATKGNRVSTANTVVDTMNFLLPGMTEVVIITKNGYVNKIPVTVLPRSNRGKAGTKVIKLNKAGKGGLEADSILSVWLCSENNTLVVNEGRSTKTVAVKDIPLGSTISTGTRLFKNPVRVELGTI